MNLTLLPTRYLQRFLTDRQIGWAWQEREEYYRQCRAYYLNTVYQKIADGGFRETIAADYGLDAATRLAGVYNPVQRAVDLYKYTLAGRFGSDQDIRIIEDNDDRWKKLIDPLDLIWQWSNINIERRLFTLYTANNGTCGIRIVARSKPTPRIYLKFEHPKRIKDMELDDRGNAKRVLLEYKRQEGELGENRETHTITELLTPDHFETYRDGKPYDMINEQENGPYATYPNVLGVTPYVIARHNYIGEDWGLPAFAGQEDKIDNLNIIAAHIDRQIIKHVRAKWFVTGSGPEPEEFDMGDDTVVYAQTDGMSGSPTMQPMIANLSLSDSIALLGIKLDELRDAMPELKATDGKFLAGQSGATIAQLRQPAEQLLFEAREQYEDALIRAQKIALSWGIILGLWDLGTGKGDREAADRAYNEGLEDHAFVARPGLPDTAFDTATLAGMEQDNTNKLYAGIEVLDRIGAISQREKVKEIHPDWTEKEIDNEIELINEGGVPAPDATNETGTTPIDVSTFDAPPATDPLLVGG